MQNSVPSPHWSLWGYPVILSFRLYPSMAEFQCVSGWAQEREAEAHLLDGEKRKLETMQEQLGQGADLAMQALQKEIECLRLAQAQAVVGGAKSEDIAGQQHATRLAALLNMCQQESWEASSLGLLRHRVVCWPSGACWLVVWGHLVMHGAAACVQA